MSNPINNNKILTNNNNMNFNESINLDNAMYLSKLTDDYFIDNIFDKDEIQQDGSKYDTKTYIKNVKTWLNKIIASKGTIKTNYKYSSVLKDHGRLYVKKFGIQSLQSDIRGFLCNELYKDYDMINAHPTILNYINNTYLEGIETPFLEKYINNRNEILKKWKVTKQEVLIWMNTESSYKGSNQFLKGIDTEFKLIQNKIMTCNDDYFLTICRSKNKKGNLKGTFLNRVLCCFENKILNEVTNIVGSKNVGSLMFDGLFINNKFNDFDIIEKFNECTKKYGVKWTEKPHSDKIQIDQDMVLPVYEDSYTKTKNIFEENHFMIEQPIIFGKESEDKTEHYLYSITDFSNLCKPYKYDINDGLPCELLHSWIGDETRRSFKRIIFNPSTREHIDNQYNIFNGFNYNERINNQDYNEEGVELFLNHIKLLCNHEQEATDYLLNYLAHLFQTPEILPEVAIVISGMKGVGKDLLTDYIQSILGLDYITRTQKFSNLFGNFNPAIKNKLVIQINEVSGKDGFTLKEDLKNFITEQNVIINEKGLKQYTIKNYARLFLYCNNENPVEITEDNRRFWVVKTGEKQNSEYYDKLYSNKNNSNILHSIYTYFLKRDLTNFNIRKFPITKKMNIMQQHNTNPLYYYLHDTYEDETLPSVFVSGKDLFYSVLNYYEEEGYSTTNISARSVKSFLCNINKNPIEYKVKKIDKKTTRGYNINIKQLLEVIKPIIE